jgi:hypothetical protein
MQWVLVDRMCACAQASCNIRVTSVLVMVNFFSSLCAMRHVTWIMCDATCDWDNNKHFIAEESLSQKQSSHLEARSLLHSGVGTTLYVNIQEVCFIVSVHAYKF